MAKRDIINSSKQIIVLNMLSIPKLNTVDELKKVSQTMWDDLPQNSINKAILSQKTSSLCESWGGHFEHVFKYTVFAGF